MIDRSTLVWLGLVVAIGFVLFHIKDRVQGLETRLAGLHQSIDDDREAIHALRAEWSYLNDPARIEALTRRYLRYKPVEARQVQALDTVPMRGHEPAAMDSGPLVHAAATAEPPARIASPAGADGPRAILVTTPSPVRNDAQAWPVRSVTVRADRPDAGIGNAPEIVRATRSLLAPPSDLARPSSAAPASSGPTLDRPPERHDTRPMRAGAARDVAARPVTESGMLKLVSAPNRAE